MDNRISILIVHYNRLEYLKGTVESIFANTVEPYELLIWDNASDEPETKEYLEYLANCKENYTKVFYSPKNVGVWRASNELIAKANSPETLGFVKFDNDVIIKTQGWLGKWKKIDQESTIGMLGANIEGKKDRSKDTKLVDHYLYLTKEGTGGAVYVKPETFRAHGYYNEDYGIYGHADKDYAKRVTLTGKHFAYDKEVEFDRFAVNNDDQTGGYREHKNLYVRRNRKLYVLNRYLYRKKLRCLSVWYKKYPVPEEIKNSPLFTWTDTGSKVHWDTGKVSQKIRDEITKYRLEKVKK